MPFMLLAVVAGLAMGVAGGGSWRTLGRRPLRLWSLLAAALVVQPAAAVAHGDLSGALVVAGYVLLAAFAAANLHLVGMPVVMVGLVMNAAVVVANGAMPVRADAVVAAGLAERGELRDLDLGPKRRLERPGDRLVPLADVIPAPGSGEVLSVGDLVLGFGTANVVARMLLPPGRHHGRRRPPALRRPGRYEPSVRAGASLPVPSNPAPP